MLCLRGELTTKTPRNEGKTGGESKSEGDHWGDTTNRAWWGFRSGFIAEAAPSPQHWEGAIPMSYLCHPHVPPMPSPFPTHATPVSHPCHPCPTRAIVLQPGGHLLRGGLVPQRAARPGLAAGGLEGAGHPGILAGNRDSLFLGAAGGTVRGAGPQNVQS